MKTKKVAPPSKLIGKQFSFVFLGILGVIITLGFYPANNDILLRGADSYGLLEIYSKIFLFICEIIASVSVFNLSFENKMLAHIGQNSLFYYLYHGLIVRFMIAPLISYFDLPQSLPYLLFYCLCILILLYFLNRVNFLKMLVNPVVK